MRNRNQFNLSETNALSARMGKLIPYYVRHLVPGDTIEIDSFIDSRFAPMQAPMMTQIDIKTWGFAVPYRLVWDDSQEFFTGVKKNGDPTDAVFPRAKYNSLPPGSTAEGLLVNNVLKDRLHIGELADYLDFAVNTSTPEQGDYMEFFSQGHIPEHSMLEPRAYQMIFNEYFRDQNIDDPVQFQTDSYIYDFSSTRARDEYNELMQLRQKRWEKDVFTSALPTPSMAQDVEIPINAEVVLSPNGVTASQQQQWIDANGNVVSGSISQSSRVMSGSTPVNLDPNGTFDVISSGATIRELTKARMLYQYLLDVSRGGFTRYKDWVKTLFGVNTADARLQRPEYIGGGSQPVIVTDVVQTSETNITSQGNLSGRAVSPSHKGHSFRYTATEHTIVMCIMCIMPKPSYGMGMPKRHRMFDRFDHYIPQFDHIGDEEIKRIELFNSPNAAQFFYDTFGYAPRYYDYKSAVNRVHGLFKSSLRYWTMARFFNSNPALSSQFLTVDDSLIDRPFFVQTSGDKNSPEQEHAYIEINNVVTAWRPMSKLSTPFV